jgi:hypothetical protein
MRRLTVCVSTAALVLFIATSASAQSRPDFSGKWTLDPASAPAAPGVGGGGGRGGGRGAGRGGGMMGGGFGMEFTAAQDANTLTITRAQGDVTMTETYRLDGSESRNQQAGRRGGPPTDVVSRASWDGNQLVIVTQLDFGGASIEQRRVLSLDGGNLIVEMTTPNPQGGAANTVRLVYRKG